MAHYVIYEDTTGLVPIRGYGQCPDEDLASQPGAGELVLETIEFCSDTEFYVDADVPEAVAKTAFPYTWSALTVVGDGSTQISLGGGSLPADALISVMNLDAGVFIVDEPETSGTAALTFDTPGTYEVTIRTIEHTDYVAEIEVTSGS